ncbi:hypothetical protein [Embleya scabrispora]|jgi:hypothetical protein|uniref:hypothetical protein n=1 Tax=Embleya scabrispora TaxID=159449 RepID=UPI000382ECF3|nr:hypothetical protein [Embleya scabrispora]MYS81486.1 hypothetical protein [Streptomyces sp. SID5474]
MNNPPDTEATSNPAGTEQQLREALETLAAGIHPAPDAYRTAHGDWQRRERRRRLILAALIVLVFTLATVIGVLVLNHAPADPGPILDHPSSP